MSSYGAQHSGWVTFGHTGAVRLLSRSQAAEKLSHAYLITGPDRVGRRTLALDLAKVVNCTPTGNLFGEMPDPPCGACPGCSRIERGIHSDVRVIDVHTPVDRPGSQAGDEEAESRRQRISIHHIHQLQREAALKPFEGRTRVFIIDGAELMSTEAANSLLKTLEEPSDDVLIVLIAPNKSSVEDTIVSRCQIVELRPVPTEEIEQFLVEKHGADEEQARLLARLSRGRPGWAIAALSDPTLAEIETQSADRIGGMVEGSLEDRFRYARDLGGQWWRDRDGVLAEIDRWSEWWRDVAMAKHGMSEQVVNIDRLEQISDLGARFSEADISTGIAAVEAARKALLANAIPRLALEVLALDTPVPQEAPVRAGRRN